MTDLLSELMGRYGTSVPSPTPAVAATFCYALTRMEDAGLVGALDEETTTAAFLGAFAAGFPLCVALAGDNAGASANCAWSQYNKSGHKDAWKNESRRGADFAMVVWASEKVARIALFQAKKSDRPSATERKALKATDSSIPPPSPFALIPRIKVERDTCFIDVHRKAPSAQLPGLEAGAASQLEAPAHTARQFMRTKGLMDAVIEDAITWMTTLEEKDIEPPDDDPDPAKQKERMDTFQKKKAAQVRRKDEAKAKLDAALDAPTGAEPDADVEGVDWIHYLAYVNGPWVLPQEHNAFARTTTRADSSVARVVCVPLSALRSQLVDERKQSGVPNFVDLASVPCHPFAEVLVSGVSASPDDSGTHEREGWLTVHAEVARRMLPALRALTNVIVATDKGGRSLDFVNDGDVAQRPSVHAETLEIAYRSSYGPRS